MCRQSGDRTPENAAQAAKGPSNLSDRELNRPQLTVRPLLFGFANLRFMAPQHQTSNPFFTIGTTEPVALSASSEVSHDPFVRPTEELTQKGGGL
jgi:hypothetical protein